LGPRLGENVELALEIRDQLGLSAQQVESLQALQVGIDMDVHPLAAEITTFRALIRGGEMDPVEGLTQLQGLLNQYQLVVEPYRLEVDAILSPTQHRMLQQVMLETRPLPALGMGRPGLPGPGRSWFWPGYETALALEVWPRWPVALEGADTFETRCRKCGERLYPP